MPKIPSAQQVYKVGSRCEVMQELGEKMGVAMLTAHQNFHFKKCVTSLTLFLKNTHTRSWSQVQTLEAEW